MFHRAVGSVENSVISLQPNDPSRANDYSIENIPLILHHIFLQQVSHQLMKLPSKQEEVGMCGT
ncbi:hypothetical protein DAI22_04g129800 [Oryza sativa Japonica Group]|nr:hypothetical protein DAI22_04g129800 [Oryza sativa Japonica Group]